MNMRSALLHVGADLARSTVTVFEGPEHRPCSERIFTSRTSCSQLQAITILKDVW